MITLTHLELEKVKNEGMEVFTQEQYNRFLEANMEVLQKGETNTLDELEKSEYEELKEEIKSFAEALVYSPSKESEFRLEKSICYIRPKQVEWDEPELIKGEDGEDIQKARSGRYTDTPLNRKLGRVGQQYGSKKEKQEGSEIKIGEAGSKGDFDSNKVYKVTKGHPAKGDILYSGDKFKISNDRKIVSVLPKGEKEWEDYKFDEIFPEGEMTGGEKKEEEGKDESDNLSNLKNGDIVKFVKKNDKGDIINGKIVSVDENKVSFINIDYPNSGTSSFSKESLSKFYNIKKE